MSGKDLSPEPRAAVRVVRPGGGAAGTRGTAPQTPPMPMAPPTSLPPWLDPVTAATPDRTTSDRATSDRATSDRAGGNGAGGYGSDGSDRSVGGNPVVGGPGDLHSADPEAGLTPEQREIRDLLHRAVGGLAPMPGALEQLRRAVPRRRRRRQQIVVSVAATVALFSLGTLALHSAGMSVDSADGPQSSRSIGTPAGNGPDGSGVRATGGPALASAGHGQVLPGVGSSFGSGSVGHGGSSSVPGASGSLHPGASLPGTGLGVPGRPGSPGYSSGLPSSSTVPVAECDRSQLGDGADSVGTPDAAGVVYGTFQVSNVSGRTCKVSEPGAVSVLAVSGTDKSWVSVAQHTAGDPAGGLPQPAPAPSPVLLAPGASYLVEFAWVPNTGTGAPDCDVSLAPGGSDSPAPDGGTDDSTSGTGGSADGASPSADGSAPTVTLGHTPGAGGSTAASAVITDACAGTVYRTDPLPATG
jgi:hypothetical protein